MKEDYRIITQLEADDYLAKHGKEVQDFSNLGIKSHMGIVYELSNGELVLMPAGSAHLKDNHPCFVYDNLESFNKMKEADYFPIPDSAKTYLELEYPYLLKMVNNIGHFKAEIEMYSKVKVPDTFNLEWFEQIHSEVYEAVGNYKISMVERQRLVLSFSILMMWTLVKDYNCSIEMKQQYETYNACLYPYLKVDDHKRDLMGDLFSVMRNPSGKDNWKSFYRELRKNLNRQ
ncbi:hypothetical protein [Pedobacter frigoris]|uniref:hypothetical protein n=1 Tax=Pedobacter frigoris TaxID=2571272 RepID=UPI00292E3540|nr:hypothetical protein [Pedobacter frigoris]